MKLLLFSDLHCDRAKSKALVAKSKTADLLIGAGDFANLRRGLNITIDILKAIKKPTVLVPGNSESYDELVAVCKDWPQATVLHGNGVKLEGIPIFGIGGGIPITPFGSWSYDFSDDEARTMLADCSERGILITHSPPKGAVDVSSSGRSLGSIAIRETILEKKPRLVVCGHIHHSAGLSAMLGSVTVINAGPDGMIWEWVE